LSEGGASSSIFFGPGARPSVLKRERHQTWGASTRLVTAIVVGDADGLRPEPVRDSSAGPFYVGNARTGQARTTALVVPPERRDQLGLDRGQEDLVDSGVPGFPSHRAGLADLEISPAGGLRMLSW